MEGLIEEFMGECTVWKEGNRMLLMSRLVNKVAQR